jgi:two-component system, NtrC family, C4-dicarboxylate transport sensor histidine kinase DctB
MRGGKKFGIRERLFLAFGSVVAMTVLASAVAWFSFGKLSDDLDQIVADNIPAVTLAARLAEIGGIITATAPKLTAAEDEPERNRASEALSKSLGNVEALFREMAPSLVSPVVRKDLQGIIDSIAINLRRLDKNVRQRFWFKAQNEELSERLRWAHADFLDEMEPMVEDSRFTIGIELEVTPKTDSQLSTLRLETRRQEALLRLNATGNLVVGLIARAATAPDQTTLDDTALFLSDATSNVQNNLKDVRDIRGSLSLQQSLQDMLTFADGPNSLLQLRRDELINRNEGRGLLEINLQLVSRLQKQIAQRVEAGHRITVAATEASRASTSRGKILLLGVALLSFIVAVLVVWLYVGRNLVRRITSLDDAMGSIAEGDLDTRVPTGGSDEISEMAASLSTFRDTLVETQTELVQAGKLAALGQLSAGVAHELNQPLAAIRSYAHNARRLIEKDQSADARETIEKISSLTERMGNTISHLRTLARRPSSNLEAVDLKDVCENALSLLESRMRETGVNITLDFPDKGVFVHAETIRVEQVLINLLSNAIDAMIDSERRELGISLQPNAEQVSIVISDSGCGISSADIDHVFDPFFTTKDVGEGLGLGLSISYNIIKDFKGKMRVSSEEGAGSKFTLTLDKAEEGSRT